MTGTDFNVIETMAKESWNTNGINVIQIFQVPFGLLIEKAGAAYGIASTVGVVLMLIFFFIELQDKVLDKNFDVETLVRSFFKIIIGVAIVTNIGPIILQANEFVIAVANDLGLSNQVSLTTDFFNAQNTAARLNSGLPVAKSEELGFSSITTVAFIMKVAVFAVLWTLSIKRAIELAIYYIISPIIFSDIFSGQVIGAAGKLKSIVGVFMELPFVMLAVTFGDAIIRGVTSISASGAALFVTVLVLISVLRTVGSAKSTLQTMFSSN